MSSLLSKRLRGEARPTQWNRKENPRSLEISTRVSYRCFDTLFSTKEISSRIRQSDAPFQKLLCEEVVLPPRQIEVTVCS